jgi:hypothetical protein
MPLRSLDLHVRTPLRIVDRHAHTGNSSASMGLLPFSFSLFPLDRITYSRTSSYLDGPAGTPHEFDGHLVYLLDHSGASRDGFRLPLGSQGTLHFALFAHGTGTATFRVQRTSGEVLFAETLPVAGSAWEPHTLSVAGVDEAVFLIDAPPDVSAGWGELVVDSDRPAPELIGAKPPESLSYLHLGDIRSRAQLGSGWYAVEDGAWRWMSNQAEATLRPLPIAGPQQFELQLFFPPDFMTRAGTPVAVFVRLNGHPFATSFYYEPGGHTVAKPVPPELLTQPVTHVSIRVGPSIRPTATDLRTLGAVVQGLGFVPAP